jgi:hypothetical protein
MVTLDYWMLLWGVGAAPTRATRLVVAMSPAPCLADAMDLSSFIDKHSALVHLSFILLIVALPSAIIVVVHLSLLRLIVALFHRHLYLSLSLSLFDYCIVVVYLPLIFTSDCCVVVLVIIVQCTPPSLIYCLSAASVLTNKWGK